jgi:hypothetical protein
VVYDIEGRSLLQQSPCAVEIVGLPSVAAMAGGTDSESSLRPSSRPARACRLSTGTESSPIQGAQGHHDGPGTI